MTETLFLEINNAGWTELSGVGTGGFVTNRSDNVIIYLQADAQPLATLNDGHRLQPGAFVNITIAGVEKAWFRSIQPRARIVLTPDA